MSTRHLLYLDACRLLAFAWKRGELEPEGEFIASENGRGDFAEYLARRRQGRFHLLANLADEGYACESIPLLRGGDRQALMARKAGQHFPEPALSCVLSLGRETTTRKNENLLISALTDPNQLQPWLQVIRHGEAALGGIYSTAQLSGQLLQTLGHTTAHCLLLCLFGDAMRESYLTNGHTVFSRLIATNAPNTPASAGLFVAEAARLRQYLIGQRRITRDARLPTFILAHPQAVADIERACADVDDLAFCVIDSHAAARQLKLKTLPEDSCCTRLFLQQLAIKQPRQQFATPELRQDYRLAQGRRLIWGLCCGMLVASSLNAANDVQQARGLSEEGGQLAGDERIISRHRQTVLAGLPRLDISHESLLQITDRHAELAQQRGRLASSLGMLGRALDHVGDIELESLDWRLDTPAPGPQPATTHQVIILEGFVRGENAASAGQALVRIEQLNELLRATPGCSVDVAKAPFASSAPSVSDDQEEDAPATQHFSLRVTLRK